MGDADVVMNGGTISGNTAYHHGGGVCVAGKSGGMGAGESAPCAFTMNGGVIAENTAYNSGGGIYLNSNDVTLNKGRIENNTADIQGGGLWFCPTGDATLSVTNGAAVFDNTAGGAGDDFVSVWKSGRTHTSTLANRMLGGGKVDWYKDGGIDDTVYSDWGVASDDPRFDPENPGESLSLIHICW